MTQPSLEEVSGNAAAAIGTAAKAVRDYAQHASESVDSILPGFDSATCLPRSRTVQCPC